MAQNLCSDSLKLPPVLGNPTTNSILQGGRWLQFSESLPYLHRDIKRESILNPASALLLCHLSSAHTFHTSVFCLGGNIPPPISSPYSPHSEGDTWKRISHVPLAWDWILGTSISPSPACTLGILNVPYIVMKSLTPLLLWETNTGALVRGLTYTRVPSLQGKEVKSPPSMAVCSPIIQSYNYSPMTPLGDIVSRPLAISLISAGR